MSETSETVDIKVDEPKEPLFSKKNKKLITDPLNDDNPITVQILGICSALAITVQVKQAFVMGVSVMVVVMMSNFVVSLLRNYIPNSIRIIVQLMIIAALVILVDQVLKAYVYDVSKQLSVFVGLIITNCIVMGRLEAFAMGNKPWPALLDGFGNGAGYAWVLIAVAVVREFFGSGKFWGVQLIPESFYEAGYFNNGLMILPPMALIVVGIIIWIQRSKNTKLIEES